MRFLLGILALVCNALLVQGQANAIPPGNWQSTFFDSPTTAIPLLMAAAIQHSAQLKSIEIEKSINGQDIKIAKKRVLEGLALGGSYTYGNLASVGVADPSNPNQFNTVSSSRYSAGVTFGLPLGQVVSRGNLIKKEELNYQRNEALRLEGENQLRQQIIQLYQNVLLAKKLLNLQQEAYVTTQTNYRLTEKQFRQGQLSLSELSAANNQLTQVTIAQETARNTYETAFMLLEEVAGAKVSSLMPTR
jgi:outer membrane protein TolC